MNCPIEKCVIEETLLAIAPRQALTVGDSRLRPDLPLYGGGGDCIARLFFWGDHLWIEQVDDATAPLTYPGELCAPKLLAHGNRIFFGDIRLEVTCAEESRTHILEVTNGRFMETPSITKAALMWDEVRIGCDATCHVGCAELTWDILAVTFRDGKFHCRSGEKTSYIRCSTDRYRDGMYEKPVEVPGTMIAKRDDLAEVCINFGIARASPDA